MFDIIAFAVGIMLVLFSAFFGKKEKVQIGAIFVATVGMIFLSVGVGVMVNDSAGGLPKNIYESSSGYMFPPENLPLVVKMGYSESGYFFMTATPYNKVKVNESIPVYYQIPTKSFENFGDIRAGSVVINDNGKLKLYSITLEV